MKFFIYAVGIMGVMIILAAAGVDTPSSGLIKSMNVLEDDNSLGFQNVKFSTLWSELVALLFLAVAGGAIIGIFSRTPPESYLIAGITAIIVGLIAGDMIFLFNLVRGFGVTWMTWGILALMAPLMIGLLLVAISYWRGND